MLQLDAFRFARCSRGINDIGKLVGAGLRFKPAGAFVLPFSVFHYDRFSFINGGRGHVSLIDDQKLRSAVFKRVADSLFRSLRINREKCRSGFHDAENRGNQVGRTIHHNGHDVLTARSARLKVAGKPVRAFIKLTICQTYSARNRREIRRFLRLAFKQRNKSALRQIRFRTFFIRKERFPFRSGQQACVGQLNIRIFSAGFNQIDKMSAPAADGFVRK
ncbi:Uncharacterised protein [Mycobacteroides abscessus subsp. massiliense]|nr:Uncharacterised protein [Mycobacteroides abscessus subsp. massiliense]